jgi:hypothetical protein
MGRMRKQKNEPEEPERQAELACALKRAGLELSRSPEGWCAIRIKPVEPVQVERAPRRGLRRRAY